MSDPSASEVLAAAATTRMRDVAGLSGVHDGPPIQAAHPFAVVEIGPESDWSHKSGAGRELRLAVTIHDRGERPVRLRGLMHEAETSLAALAGEIDGWQVVTCTLVRSRALPAGKGEWVGSLDWRARMLRVP